MAFTAGITLTSGDSFQWLWILPATWFVGMLFSHLVFDRCALIELVRRFKKVYIASVAKTQEYNCGPKRGVRMCHKAEIETSDTYMPEPKKLNEYETDTHPCSQD